MRTVNDLAPVGISTFNFYTLHLFRTVYQVIKHDNSVEFSHENFTIAKYWCEMKCQNVIIKDNLARISLPYLFCPCLSCLSPSFYLSFCLLYPHPPKHNTNI